ncbi:MAG: MarR family winged helix-turn-helix transcriptional regulator [Candidatus Saccharimonadales bacterium]
MGPTSQLLYLVQHVASVMSKQTEQLLQEQLGIGMSQYRILTALEWTPRVQQKTIADNLGQTEASISRQVSLLAQKGLLVIKRDATNRRKHIIMPTPMGMQINEAATAIIRRSLGPEYSALGDDQLQRLIAGLQSLHNLVCKPGQLGACDHTLSQ